MEHGGEEARCNARTREEAHWKDCSWRALGIICQCGQDVGEEVVLLGRTFHSGRKGPVELDKKGMAAESQPPQERALVAEGLYLFSACPSSGMRTSSGTASLFTDGITRPLGSALDPWGPWKTQNSGHVPLCSLSLPYLPVSRFCLDENL